MSILQDANDAVKVESMMIDEEQTAEDAAPIGADDNGAYIDLSFLKAHTGAGDILDYVTHPLNTSGSKGVAQMLRGFTGIIGALDLAVIDIIIGAFNIVREKRNATDAKQ